MTSQRTDRTTTPHRARRWLPLALAVAACVLAPLARPAPASAAVTRIGVFPDINYGPLTNYGTGCSYTVEAFLTSAVGPVSLYDNGIHLATVPPTGGVALFTWVPAARGTHTLSAVQAPEDGVVASVDIPVGVGIPIGTSCLVI